VEVNVKDMEPYSNTMTVSQVNLNPLHNIKLKRSQKVIAQEKLSKDANLVQKGNVLFKEKKYDEALTAYQQFLEKNPDFYQLHFNIANCHKEKRDYDTAITEYKKVLDKAGDDQKGKELKAKTLAAIGEVYLLKDDRQTASDYFKKSIDMNPADEILAYNVAEIYFAGNKVEEAITYYRMAAKIKPNWSEPYLKIGYAYMNQGKFKEAIDSLNTFLKMDPNSPQAPVVKDIIKSLKQD
jgi:stress-induced-phosphoprotein 1